MIDGLVSIITPCYNGGRFIADTIESVLGQTYAQWEMIVVDDGSADDTPQIAERYAARDSRIQLIRQQNAGTAHARNTGMKQAKGRYIALLDADDLWEPDFLEKQLAFMRKTGAVCVCSAYRHIDENGREIQHPTVPLDRITPKDMRVMNRIGCLTGLYDADKHGKIYLHEALRSIRDDYAYWYDIVCLEGEARGNPQILARYRVQTSSTTGNKLKLVSKQYHFYRQYLKHGVLTACVNTVRWGVSGIRKFS
ncbi:MAG: glycosyltransferase family 2 protein [Clostridia bacterium]|nr:glycosyltransferase family 2 protein [Clostridia bacterium]MBQ9038722.1 glycosyltransferase family 2 protein [Clostridia bacterium]